MWDLGMIILFNIVFSVYARAPRSVTNTGYMGTLSDSVYNDRQNIPSCAKNNALARLSVTSRHNRFMHRVNEKTALAGYESTKNVPNSCQTATTSHDAHFVLQPL